MSETRLAIFSASIACKSKAEVEGKARINRVSLALQSVPDRPSSASEVYQDDVVIPNEKELRQIKQITSGLDALGPRGSATSQERRAAEFVQAELQRMGVATAIENFRGHNSYGIRILIHLGLGLLALVLLVWWPLISMTLSLLTLISFGLEMSSFANGLSSFFSGRPSQNVVGQIPAAGLTRRRIVVVAHLDTRRTGWIWRPSLIRTFAATLGQAPGPLKAPLFWVTVVLMSQIGLGVLIGLTEGTTALNSILLLFALLYAVGIVVVGQWAVGRFVPGANDNASGVASAIILAKRWSHFRHEGTDLVILISGCRETGLCGAAAWTRNHRQELAQVPTVFLNLDTMGCQQLHFLRNECAVHGLILEYPDVLLDLCRTVATDMGLDFTLPRSLPTHTDGLAMLVRGLPGITITTCDEGPFIVKDHSMWDRWEQLDCSAVYRAADFSWRVLLELEDFGLVEDVQAGDAVPAEPAYSPIALMDSALSTTVVTPMDGQQHPSRILESNARQETVMAPCQ